MGNALACATSSRNRNATTLLQTSVHKRSLTPRPSRVHRLRYEICAEGLGSFITIRAAAHVTTILLRIIDVLVRRLTHYWMPIQGTGEIPNYTDSKRLKIPKTDYKQINKAKKSINLDSRSVEKLTCPRAAGDNDYGIW